MTASKILTAAFTVMVVTASAGMASAQQHGQADNASMMGHQGMMQSTGSKRGEGTICGTMASHIDGRLAFLKAELKITPGQDSLWNDYAAAVRNNAQAVTASCTSMTAEDGSKALSLPDRMDAQAKYLSVRVDGLRATEAALKPLYAALSDAQKQAADQLIRSATGMM